MKVVLDFSSKPFLLRENLGDLIRKNHKTTFDSITLYTFSTNLQSEFTYLFFIFSILNFYYNEIA